MILSRQFYGCNDGYYGGGGGFDNNCNSPWNSYGRWIVVVVIIVAVFLLLFCVTCFSARRRRRRGFAPYRGTGWLAGRTPPGHAPAQYTGNPEYGAQQYNQYNPQAASAPPPEYNQYGGGGGAQQDYYGQQQSGIELQSPQNVYQAPMQGGGQVYPPPMDAPPGHGKKDNIIR